MCKMFKINIKKKALGLLAAAIIFISLSGSAKASPITDLIKEKAQICDKLTTQLRDSSEKTIERIKGAREACYEGIMVYAEATPEERSENFDLFRELGSNIRDLNIMENAGLDQYFKFDSPWERSIEFGCLALIIFMYLVPSYIAYKRKHGNLAPIFIINFVFGWTIVGWIICAAWALSNNVMLKK